MLLFAFLLVLVTAQWDIHPTFAFNQSSLQATFPLYRGVTKEGVVWFVILEASDLGVANMLGCSYAPKLSFADIGVGEHAPFSRSNHIMSTGRYAGLLSFESGSFVDFSPVHNITYLTNTEKLPTKLKFGSLAESYYSPLVRLSSGAILNAPIIAQVGTTADQLLIASQTRDHSILHDRIVSINPYQNTVTFQMSLGYRGGSVIPYLCLEASDPGIAALEKATFVPSLKKIPVYAPSLRGHDRPTFEATTTGFAVVNGPAEKFVQQGYNTLTGPSSHPFHVFANPLTPNGNTPFINFHLIEWARDAIENGHQNHLKSFVDVLQHAEAGNLHGPRGSLFGSSGIILNVHFLEHIKPINSDLRSQ